MDLKLKKLKNRKKKCEKIEVEKEKILSKIDQIRDEYYKDLKSMGETNQAVCAMVVFRSMEGV